MQNMVFGAIKPNIGSNATGCSRFAERELHQNLLTTFSLANMTHADHAERRRLGNMATLTCPIARDLLNNEGEVYVEEARPRRRSELIFEQPGLVFDASTMMSNGQIIENLNASCIVLKDAYVSQRGYVCAENRLYLESAQFVLPNWESGRGDDWFYKLLPFRAFDPQTRTALFNFESAELRRGSAFVFSSSNSTVNFGHFVHDLLILVPMFKRARAAFPDLKVLVHENFKYPIQNFIFDEIMKEEMAFGHVMIGNIQGIYDHVLVPDLQFGYEKDEINVQSAQEVRVILRDMAQKYRNFCREETNKRIFVSRKDGTSNAYNRGGLDHDKLESIFAEQGYDCVSVSQLEPAELMSVFANAEVVAGVHGAGLLNVLFSQAKCPLLIEIDAFQEGWGSIERFVRSCGIRHKRMRGFDDKGGVREEVLSELFKG